MPLFTLLAIPILRIKLLAVFVRGWSGLRTCVVSMMSIKLVDLIVLGVDEILQWQLVD